MRQKKLFQEPVLNGLPPDAAPHGVKRDGTPAKKRGRKPKPNHEPEASEGELVTQPVKTRDGERSLTAEEYALRKLMDVADWELVGTDPRWVFLIGEDVSPSERKYEPVWVEAGNSIPTALAADPIGRARIDVLLVQFAEFVKVAAFNTAGAFKMPDRIEYGEGTLAEPVLKALPILLDAYREDLENRGLPFGGALVLLTTDFHFSDDDDYPDQLKKFQAWERDNDDTVTVVPVGFGDWLPEVAETFSTTVAPVDLRKLPVGEFIRLMSRTVSGASRATTAREGHERIRNVLKKLSKKPAE